MKVGKRQLRFGQRRRHDREDSVELEMHRASLPLSQARQVGAGNGKADMLESHGPLLLLPPLVGLAPAASANNEQAKKSVRRRPLRPQLVELAH